MSLGPSASSVLNGGFVCALILINSSHRTLGCSYRNWWEESSNVLGLYLRHPFVVFSLTDVGRRGWWCHLGLPCTVHGARLLAVQVPGWSHPLPEPCSSSQSRAVITHRCPWSAEKEFFNLIQNGQFSTLHRHKRPPPFTLGLGGVAAGHVPLLCQGIAQLLALLANPHPRGAERTHRFRFVHY